MNKTAMLALIKKDLRYVTSNRKLLTTLLIVPLMLIIILPSIFILSIHFAPNDPDITRLLASLPVSMVTDPPTLALCGLILNSILPIFFLIIPIMTASIMAASAFVGEKERHTLETLLYCPLTLRQIFQAKVLSAFFLSMIVSFISFISMFTVVEIELFFLMGSPLLPGVNWLIVMLLIAPSISLIAITLIVRQSAKAKSIEESQQAAVFLVIPLILLVAGQFSGILLLSVWILLGIGFMCAVLAWIFLQNAMKRFTYEKLLQ